MPTNKQLLLGAVAMLAFAAVVNAERIPLVLGAYAERGDDPDAESSLFQVFSAAGVVLYEMTRTVADDGHKAELSMGQGIRQCLNGKTPAALQGFFQQYQGLLTNTTSMARRYLCQVPEITRSKWAIGAEMRGIPNTGPMCDAFNVMFDDIRDECTNFGARTLNSLAVFGKWAGIIVAIIAGLAAIAFVVLKFEQCTRHFKNPFKSNSSGARSTSSNELEMGHHQARPSAAVLATGMAYNSAAAPTEPRMVAGSQYTHPGWK